jgi:maltose O-acetyltransferase
MATEREKMLAGELYDAADAELTAARQRTRSLLHRLNTSEPDEGTKQEILRELLPQAAECPSIQPPFYCDYGSNITLGHKVYFNFNCVVLDVCPVRIGSNVLFGPAVQVYAATHPLDVATRRQWLELGRSVDIGDDVWVGGGAIICPGVSIGAGSVIAAGAVVVKDVPPGVVVGGNPARILRSVP